MKIMTPSVEKATDDQFGKISDLLRAGLRKAGLPLKEVQDVIEKQGKPLAHELVGVIRKYVDAVSNLITRFVSVDRNRKPMEVIDATGRSKYVTDKVVESMPKGEGKEAEVIFFQVNRNISNDDLEKEYALRGLKPDPYAQAKVNEEDPAFADTKPNGTQWKDSNGKWCFIAFYRWHVDERYVRVFCNDYVWSGVWWFGGVPVSSPENLST